MMKITTMLLKASGYILLVFFQVLSITILIEYSFFPEGLKNIPEYNKCNV